MRSRRPQVDHSEAVARRLALLSAELDVARAVEASRSADGEAAPHPDVVRAGLTRISGAPVPLPGEPGGGPAQASASAQGLVGAGPGDRRDVELPHLVSPRPLPEPGRHAQRRPAARVALPPSATAVAGVVQRLGAWQPGQVSIVLAGLLLAVVLACGWLLLGRSESEVVAVIPTSEEVDVSAASGGPAAASTGLPATRPGASPASSAPASSGPAGAPQAGDDIVVDVAGKVRRPGLVVLPAGSRVADALERAGGVRRGVVTSDLNLARLLVDGEQILVGVAPPAGVRGGGGAGPSGAGPGTPAGAGAGAAGLVSINSADAATLDGLPGVGPVTAGSIIEWRTTHGGFSSVEDLLEVRGIGDATLARLLPHITL